MMVGGSPSGSRDSGQESLKRTPMGVTGLTDVLIFPERGSLAFPDSPCPAPPRPPLSR